MILRINRINSVLNGIILSRFDSTLIRSSWIPSLTIAKSIPLFQIRPSLRDVKLRSSDASVRRLGSIKKRTERGRRGAVGEECFECEMHKLK